MNTWNSNTFVVILVCAMNLHCGNHDLMIVAISNMFLMMKEMRDGLEGLEVFVTEKKPLFRSNITPQCRIQPFEQVLVEGEAVDLLRRCGKMCLGQIHHSDGGHHILGEMALWILLCF